MLGKKIELKPRIRKLIIDSRHSARESDPHMTADYISEKIGRAKSWLSQIENGRLKSIKSNDLINVFCVIKNKNKDLKKDREYIENYLDDEILYITITEKHGLYDEDGNVLNFLGMLSFQSARGHIKFAGEKLNDIFHQLQNMSISEIQNNLQAIMKQVKNTIVDWLSIDCHEIYGMLSDEISTINLYFTIETSIKIYNEKHEYYGLNPLNISFKELETLKDKLDINYLFKEGTIIKPLNDYTNSEIDDVILHFSTEQYMTWKHKGTYLGNDDFPMVVNYKTSLSTDNFVNYENLNSLMGLSEEDYKFIIKQLYYHVDILFKKCKFLLESNNEHQYQNKD